MVTIRIIDFEIRSESTTSVKFRYTEKPTNFYSTDQKTGFDFS